MSLMQPRPSGDDDVGVIISLSIALGMIVGALAALWIAAGGAGKAAWWIP